MPATVRRLAIAAAVVALALPTAACTDASPRPSASASATAAAPIFANDEEALAAAEEAYAAYIQTDAQILADGGTSPERVRKVVTPKYAERLLPQYESFATNGLRAVGEAALDTTSLVERTPGGLTIYGCLDVSNVHVIDSAGSDITPTENRSRQPLVLGFVGDENELFLDWSDKWSGDDFC